VPPEAHAYATCGEDEARAYAGRPPAALEGVRVFFVNRGEALSLTGAGSVEEAARSLSELAETVVVTLAAGGAIACSAGEIVEASAEPVERPVDTTGAGDLLVAAYVWADLRGAELADRLRWGVLYASLAVTTPTGIGGALREHELLAAGVERGLTAPSQRAPAA
jgi:sugar/nucleoside kinase (ribokinase family)